MNSIRDIYAWVTAESLLLFIEDTESSPHDNFPDTTAFVTSIFGLWTTPTGRHLLGIKVTPCLFQHIACYFREPNGVLTVEVWPRPQGFGLFDLPGGTKMMEEEEYAWVLGCSVEELGLAPSTSEDLSERCIDTKLLKGTDTPEPGTTEAKDEGSTGTTPEEVNDPEEENREEHRIDKGKGRAMDSPVTNPMHALKRKRSLEQDDAPGPSTKRVSIPKDEDGEEDEEGGDAVEEDDEDENDEDENEGEDEEGEDEEGEEEEGEEGDREWEEEDDDNDDEDGSYTEMPSNAQKHVKKWKNEVKYKRKCFTCEVCQRTFTTKKNLERHTPTHLKDKILFVCAGGQGPNGKTFGHRCLTSYARVDSFRRHIFDTDGRRKRPCHTDPTEMTMSAYRSLCRRNGAKPKTRKGS